MINVIENKIHLATKLESKITNYLKSLGKKHRGKLEGLNYKFKGREKLYEKAYNKKIENIRDILRYTFVFNDHEYTEGVYKIYTALDKNKDFKTKHSWVKQKWCLGDMYQGINTSWSYKDLFVFELQFHTHISHKMKTKGELHDLYDKYNSDNCDNLYINSRNYKKNKCHKMRIKMNKIEDSIPVPAELIGDKCGLDIGDWYRIIKNKSKMKSAKSDKKSANKSDKKSAKKKTRSKSKKKTRSKSRKKSK